MRHFYLNNKAGTKLIVHVEDLREAFQAADGRHTVCVLKITKKDGGDTYVLVTETVSEIWEQAKKMKYEELNRDDKGIKAKS